MPTPYDALPGIESLFYLAAVAITLIAVTGFLAAWAFYSHRRLFGWYSSITASTDRWESIILPPKDVSREIFWFVVVAAVNALLIAAGVFATGYYIHVT